MSKISCLLILLFSVVAVRADLKTEVVEYKHGEAVLEGYLAYDAAVTDKRPGILVVHEWVGHGDYVRMRAEQLARLGYVAFAADMYGKGIRAKDAKEAAGLAGLYRSNRTLMRSRANVGLQVLLAHPLVDTRRIAAIGYCFGGTTVLELARSGVEIAGVVSFHGNLETPNLEDAKNIKGKVLVLHGGDDPFVPMEQVAKFAEEMRKAGVDWQLVMYGGAVHSFTNLHAGNNPARGAAYHEKADIRSWEAMKLFFAELFR